MQKYPFQINTKILRLTSEISELVGSMSSLSEAARSPQLRRSNRIKTIYSSLAIEQNTLSLDQVTAVVSGKRVLAPPKDIAEVQNAFEIYDRLRNLLSISAATANRVLNGMAEKGMIIRFRKGKSWAYRKN